MRPAGARGFRCLSDRWVRRSRCSRLPTGYIHRPLWGLTGHAPSHDPPLPAEISRRTFRGRNPQTFHSVHMDGRVAGTLCPESGRCLYHGHWPFWVIGLPSDRGATLPRSRVACASGVCTVSRPNEIPRMRSDGIHAKGRFMASPLLQHSPAGCVQTEQTGQQLEMRKKHRIILILIVGALVGGLVIAASLPGREGVSPAMSPLDQACLVGENLLIKLGLLPPRSNAARDACIANLKHFDAWKATRALEEQKNACIANLKRIDRAKATWALENKKTNSDIPPARRRCTARMHISVTCQCVHRVAPIRPGACSRSPSARYQGIPFSRSAPQSAVAANWGSPPISSEGGVVCDGLLCRVRVRRTPVRRYTAPRHHCAISFGHRSRSGPTMPRHSS